VGLFPSDGLLKDYKETEKVKNEAIPSTKICLSRKLLVRITEIIFFGKWKGYIGPRLEGGIGLRRGRTNITEWMPVIALDFWPRYF